MLGLLGQPDIDGFEAVMMREDRQRGFFVSFAYSSDAQQECTAFHKRTGRIIKLLPAGGFWMKSRCRRYRKNE